MRGTHCYARRTNEQTKSIRDYWPFKEDRSPLRGLSLAEDTEYPITTVIMSQVGASAYSPSTVESKEGLKD